MKFLMWSNMYGLDVDLDDVFIYDVNIEQMLEDILNDN